MTAEIIPIGSEILLGDQIDTNSAYIAQQLRGIGLDVLYISAVDDDQTRITNVIAQGCQRSRVIITTGGLGPTEDDKTRDGVAAATARPLVFQQDLLDQIEARFAGFGRKMSPNNRQQAYIPQDAIAIENPVGTAPAFMVDDDDYLVICLPGVPREMKYLLEHNVLPFLRQRLNLTEVIKMRILHTTGMGESTLDEQIRDLEQLSNPVVGLAAHSGVVDIRITAKADSEAEADRLIRAVEAKARARLGNAIFGVDDEELAKVALARLANAGETVAAVESGTGGSLGYKLAEADNGQGTFVQSQLLPGSATKLTDEALRQLALDAARNHQADYGLACMIAIRDKEHDIGVAVAHAQSGQTKVRVRIYTGYHTYARDWSVNGCLNLLRTWQPEQANNA